MTLSFVVFPAEADAAANKAVRLRVSFNGKSEKTEADWDRNSYQVAAANKTQGNLKSKTIVSCKVYIPKTLLKKNGDFLNFYADMNLFTYAPKNTGSEFWNKKTKTEWNGSISGMHVVYVTKKGNKCSLKVYNSVKDKNEKSPKKYATIKSSGKYYVLNMKGVLENKYIDTKGKTRKLNTKKKYILSPVMTIHGAGKTSGYIYVDKITVKAVKSYKITFNKKDYRAMDVCRNDGKKVKWKITKL